MRYPRVLINLADIESNVIEITKRAKAQNIEIFGVTKVVHGNIDITKKILSSGCIGAASSRIDHLKKMKTAGINEPLMLVRIPMKSELPEVLKYSDISLQSDIGVLKELNSVAEHLGKNHGIILMADLGDLREGFRKEEELISAAIFVEESDKLELLGVGTNLGCYGSVVPTREKLTELVDVAEKTETVIGRKLKYISGGATSSFARVLDGDMPERINMLRMGEGLLFGNDLINEYGCEMPYMKNGAFVMEAEVIEVKEKPSFPIGELGVDAFGRTPVYEDKGIRKRALIAVGKADYADEMKLTPIDSDVVLVGASSDHTILDVTDAKRNIESGDIIKLKLQYQSALYATNTKDVEVVVR